MSDNAGSTRLPDRLIFGCAYYDEYMPYERVDKDMSMMKSAGITTIRIAESTWSTLEPQPGVFDFSHVDRVLDAAGRFGIQVIVGTPTYAVPAWLVAMHPDVLADTPNGHNRYGARQIMDIVNPSYRYYGECVIRKLISHVSDNPQVIGYQVDNETKYYDCVSPDVQRLFVKDLRRRFDDDLDRLNATFGLDYWSNRIDSWEDFPDLTGTINASLGSAFDRFRRSQVSRYLAWQAGIVREYAREDQFVTHNFDFDWGPGWSYGIQPAVDHFEAAECLDVAGVDIYHPTEDNLTGKEIAFGGDMNRSLKGGANYLVLETEAQGQNGWLPYPGQLRLQAYSHLASGANGVMYWHWHSIHNSFETYWKGLLSQDMEPNPTYEEAGQFGRQIAQKGVGERLINLQKRNKVAIMVGNDSLTALDWFSLETGFPRQQGQISYNDVIRRVYDALFELNIECDFISDKADRSRLGRYALIVVPALYSTNEDTLRVLADYVHQGGHLVATLRSFVADENLKVWHDKAPHLLIDVFGIDYNQFTRPGKGLTLDLHGTDQAGPACQGLIELLNPRPDTQILASYDHPVWGRYAAVTRHDYGRGSAEWIGTLPSAQGMRLLLSDAADVAGLSGPARDLAGLVTVREGTNALGEQVAYLLNYSSKKVKLDAPYGGHLLVADGQADPQAHVDQGQSMTIGPWELAIIVR
ncbi:beta-galactosidase [Bifidobacterium sp. B4081]|uniref:beta-galactosidase n=1 Tax=unclassified Bifidobacterium TaxID=2608897 RepID=UPI00226A5E99|nr:MULTISPECIES: beta-galactosidase [unclassified Bifidobacterium]MCX8644515.1 beta-galactosidase [Bifidobacterium sp. B4077]MCX8646371.1 beta-galactosidase [Bifidobacterium sp. B4081]MCX8667978.1 beta-galactosidase [Bifidobacterium sp. B3998]MCX8687453.1 beta-galactosidase [Bifidobacterium sp. B4142]